MLLMISSFSLRLNVDLKGKGSPSRFYITCPYQFLLGELSLTGMWRDLTSSASGRHPVLPILCGQTQANLHLLEDLSEQFWIEGKRKERRKDGEINTTYKFIGWSIQTKRGNQGCACVITCPSHKGTQLWPDLEIKGFLPPAGPSPATSSNAGLSSQEEAFPRSLRWILCSIFTRQRKGKILL